MKGDPILLYELSSSNLLNSRNALLCEYERVSTHNAFKIIVNGCHFFALTLTAFI